MQMNDWAKYFECNFQLNLPKIRMKKAIQIVEKTPQFHAMRDQGYL